MQGKTVPVEEWFPQNQANRHRHMGSELKTGMSPLRVQDHHQKLDITQWGCEVVQA